MSFFPNVFFYQYFPNSSSSKFFSHIFANIYIFLRPPVVNCALGGLFDFFDILQGRCGGAVDRPASSNRRVLIRPLKDLYQEPKNGTDKRYNEYNQPTDLILFFLSFLFCFFLQVLTSAWYLTRLDCVSKSKS